MWVVMVWWFGGRLLVSVNKEENREVLQEFWPDFLGEGCADFCGEGCAVFFLRSCAVWANVRVSSMGISGIR